MTRFGQRVVLFAAIVSAVLGTSSAWAATAPDILAASGVKGGLVVHVGCGDGKLTAALRARDGYLVHGIDVDTEKVQKVRAHIRERGLCGAVSADTFDGSNLPYVDNSVNLLVVASGQWQVASEDIARVLAPRGVLLAAKPLDSRHSRSLRSLGEGGSLATRSPVPKGWFAYEKPVPPEIDDWTHYLYDPSNNAVSHDSAVAPPRRMQWVGGPRYSRHHDRMSSVSAVVSGGGRVFTIFDEAPRFSILPDSQWALIARDAFNGVILWKRPIGKWFTHLWPLKSGPAQQPRRLVASDDRVFATLAWDAPLSALDAATGETLRTYEGTKATEEVLLLGNTLVALVFDASGEQDYFGHKRFGGGYGAKFWDEKPRRIVAIDADGGRTLWSKSSPVLPVTLAADGKRVVFHDGRAVVALDLKNGHELWRSPSIARSDVIRGFFAPTLVLIDDVVLFSGGETAGKQTGSWYEKGEDTLTAVDAATGKVMWTAYHPPSGYRSAEDVLVVDGVAWSGETTSGRVKGLFTGRDIRTGRTVSEFEPDVETYWFHHRCYRGKATDNYLLMSRTGIEFLDLKEKTWTPNHWVRGACLYGVMPANGLIYAPQHPCACYLEAKLSGFVALAPAPGKGRMQEARDRLQKGAAYGSVGNRESAIGNSPGWPTYRGATARSGYTKDLVPAGVKRAWSAEIGGRLSAPVVANGKVFVTAVNEHAVHALDAASGKALWRFSAGARIDSPPTIHGGLALFGSADGYVYCLRESDGALAWRFRVAPADRRMMHFEQLESVWPVPGNVLVHNGQAYAVAGRSMFLDGGLRLVRLDPATGELLSETVLDDRDTAADKALTDYVSWLNMPPALPDILSTDGKLVYMRSQPFTLDGARLPLEAMPNSGNPDAGAPPATQNPEQAHLFSPTGFLDDSWWHRTYWMFGTRFVSGWCGYFRAGKAAPSGRILVHDDSTIYGFGRKPKYYRWTTQIEHQLFATKKPHTGPGEAPPPPPPETRVSVARSASLDPSGKALTVEAWVKAGKPNGVILAHGGTALGYTLYLEGGRARFGIRSDGKSTVAKGKRRLPKEWTHVAGVLTEKKQLRVYVNGQPDGDAKAPTLIKANPSDGMQLGCDEDTNVGDYGDRYPFDGSIDEVRVYHRALSTEEVAAGAKGGVAGDNGLVLDISFDGGKATDGSGKSNHGKVEGAESTDGKVGRAMKFVGGGSSRGPGMEYGYEWTLDLPLFARAMVLADKTVFVAGPPDLLDEESAFRQINAPETKELLNRQVAAYQGKSGALLWAIDGATGKKLADLELTSPPVFDGMAAANGSLYLATMDGEVLSLK